MLQRKLDFSVPEIRFVEKKTNKMTFACGDDMQDALKRLARRHDTSVSELVYFFVAKGISKATFNSYIADNYGDKKLSELLSKL